MKVQILLLCAAVPAMLAQNPPTLSTLPEFAADWRVTGVIRQGGRAQANLERTGMRARFAEEGDRLPGDVMVLQVDYASRSVTLAKGGETAVIRVGCSMAPPPPPPKAAATQPSSNKGSPPNAWPNPPEKVSALRDGNGRWHVVFPTGRAVDMHAFAEQHGVEFRFDPVLNPRLDGSKKPCAFRLTPEEVIHLDLLDQKRSREWQQLCKSSHGQSETQNLYTCGAGVSTFHIDPYGQLSPCEMAQFQAFDLRNGSFKEAWNLAFPEFLSLQATGDYPCQRCGIFSLCSQCPGWAWMENRNPEMPVEYLCRIAHLRAAAFAE